MDEATQPEISNRRAVLSALEQILDARSLETLFAGPPEEAAVLYDVLEEAAKGVRSVHYWEICRTARRRQLTADFVADRAAVLLGSIHERRKYDLYRVLDVPPLSSFDTIQQRYRELAKVEHPDVGGDGARFRRLKEAYDVLKDDGRRAEYEAFWARALGPFERTQVPGMAAFQVVSPTTTTTAPATVTEVTSEAAVDHATASPAQAAPESDLANITTGLRQVASLLHDWDQRAFPGEALDGPSGRVLRWASELRGTVGVVVDDLELRRADVDGLLAQFEVVRAQINQLAQLKYQFASDALGR